LINLLIDLSIDLYIQNDIYLIMRIKNDILSQKILEILKKTDEPLETIEILGLIKNSTRIKALYRLYNLRGEMLIKGKQVGSGKGTWIWWKNE
jgi:hypothetical protein